MILFALMLVFPKEGIQVWGRFKLEFPDLRSLFLPDTAASEGIDEILARLDATDSIPTDISKLDTALQAKLSLHYPRGDKSVLYPFFAQLDALGRGKPGFHILHFGDSQIEGDRMTGFVRAQLQARFGGSGPGLLALDPLVNSFALIPDRSDNWARYTLFGIRDEEVEHNGYGIMAAFCRFSPLAEPIGKVIKKDGKKFREKPPLIKATATWTKNSNTYRTAGEYNKMMLFYGNARRTCLIKVHADGSIAGKDTLMKGGGLYHYDLRFRNSPDQLQLELQSRDGPDFYGISLESEDGVKMDNISMRGSAGTIFGAVDPYQMQVMLQALNVKLFVLQFGGNAVPAITSLKEAESYGRSFRGQIEYLQRMNPAVPVIVIGPADMSENDQGKMITREYLVPVRDAIRNATLEAGGIFYDLFEVMGGRNSMPKWVEKDLAGSDYVHLSVEGSRRLAEAFYKALMRDYESYKLKP